MLSNNFDVDNELFRDKLIYLLQTEHQSYSQLIKPIIFMLREYNNSNKLLYYLKNYLVTVHSPCERDPLLKKIIKLICTELLLMSENDLQIIQISYCFFNIIPIKLLVSNDLLLSKLYNSLLLQNQYGSNGLCILLTRVWDMRLLSNLITLAKDRPRYIKMIFSALPVKNNNNNCALNELQHPQHFKLLQGIKKLLSPSWQLRIKVLLCLSPASILLELAEITPFCLNCLAVPFEHKIYLEQLAEQELINMSTCFFSNQVSATKSHFPGSSNNNSFIDFSPTVTHGVDETPNMQLTPKPYII